MAGVMVFELDTTMVGWMDAKLGEKSVPQLVAYLVGQKEKCSGPDLVAKTVEMLVVELVQY